jgi:hypothetical protein
MKRLLKILIIITMITLGYFVVDGFIYKMSFLSYIFIELIITSMHVFGNGLNKYIKIWD